MCKVCGIQNIYKVEIFTDNEINQYISNVMSGAVTPTFLDLNFHYKTSLELEKAVIKGYGKTDRLRDKLIESCYIFAAAKQHKFIIQLQGLELEDARKMFNLYYVDYFSAEVDSAEYQATGANEFNQQLIWSNEQAN